MGDCQLTTQVPINLCIVGRLTSKFHYFCFPQNQVLNSDKSATSFRLFSGRKPRVLLFCAQNLVENLVVQDSGMEIDSHVMYWLTRLQSGGPKV